jgi:flagellin
MGMFINTNVASLNSQRNLGKSVTSLETSMQRLSSGLRINSAKDDAAGLQISNRLTSQINGLNVAVRNANDGISMAQTAEGALQESTNILQRMRDLAIQAANGTFSDSDRAAIQQEISQLQSELDRIAETSTFGSRKLLDGSFGTESFQVGASAFETVSVAINSFYAEDMGAQTLALQKSAFNGGAGGAAVSNSGNAAIGLGGIGLCQAAGSINSYLGPAGTANAAVEIGIIGGLGSATASVTGTASAYELQRAIQQVAPQTGVDADARTIVGLNFDLATYTGGGLSNGTTVTFELRGRNADTTVQAPTIKATIENTEDLSAIANAINAQSGETGVSASINSSGDLIMVSERGDTIELNNISLSGGDTTALAISARTYEYEGDTTDTAQVVSGITMVPASLTTLSTTTTEIAFVGVIRTTSNDNYTLSATAAINQGATGQQQSSLSSVEDLDVGTAIGAQQAIDVVDGAISYIDAQRASLGAVQNRLQSTIANLANVSENAAGSRSRIRDTDFAIETAELTKNQILQQAGTSILAQANQLPQAALSLLGG